MPPLSHRSPSALITQAEDEEGGSFVVSLTCASADACMVPACHRTSIRERPS